MGILIKSYSSSRGTIKLYKSLQEYDWEGQDFNSGKFTEHIRRL